MTPEEIEAIAAHDARVRTVQLSIEIETELRRGNGLHLLMAALRADADKAMAEFARANPANTQEIIGLQARVHCFQYALDTFSVILQRGQAAEDQLRGEDQIGSYERND